LLPKIKVSGLELEKVPEIRLTGRFSFQARNSLAFLVVYAEFKAGC